MASLTKSTQALSIRAASRGEGILEPAVSNPAETSRHSSEVPIYFPHETHAAPQSLPAYSSLDVEDPKNTGAPSRRGCFMSHNGWSHWDSLTDRRKTALKINLLVNVVYGIVICTLLVVFAVTSKTHYCRNPIWIALQIAMDVGFAQTVTVCLQRVWGIGVLINFLTGLAAWVVFYSCSKWFGCGPSRIYRMEVADSSVM